MFFLDKQPIQCSDRPETTGESILLQLFDMPERGPVEQTKIPQRFIKPVQYKEPPPVLEQTLPSCRVFSPESPQ